MRPGCHADKKQFAEEPLLQEPERGADDFEEPQGVVLRRARALLALLQAHDFAGPFLAPFDPVALGLSAYDDIVKRRMDLGTVRESLDAALHDVGKDPKRKERAVELRAKQKVAYGIVDFAKDTRTVFHNCRIYNAEESAIVRMATHLSKVTCNTVCSHRSALCVLSVQFIRCSRFLLRDSSCLGALLLQSKSMNSRRI